MQYYMRYINRERVEDSRQFCSSIQAAALATALNHKENDSHCNFPFSTEAFIIAVSKNDKQTSTLRRIVVALTIALNHEENGSHLRARAGGLAEWYITGLPYQISELSKDSLALNHQ